MMQKCSVLCKECEKVAVEFEFLLRKALCTKFFNEDLSLPTAIEFDFIVCAFFYTI